MPDSYQQLHKIIAEVLWVQVRSVAQVGPCFEDVTGLSQPLAEQGKVILESGGEKSRASHQSSKGRQWTNVGLNNGLQLESG